jgi:hypothetical protein
MATQPSQPPPQVQVAKAAAPAAAPVAASADTAPAAAPRQPAVPPASELAAAVTAAAARYGFHLQAGTTSSHHLKLEAATQPPPQGQVAKAAACSNWGCPEHSKAVIVETIRIQRECLDQIKRRDQQDNEGTAVAVAPAKVPATSIQALDLNPVRPRMPMPRSPPATSAATAATAAPEAAAKQGPRQRIQPPPHLPPQGRVAAQPAAGQPIQPPPHLPPQGRVAAQPAAALPPQGWHAVGSPPTVPTPAWACPGDAAALVFLLF